MRPSVVAVTLVLILAATPHALAWWGGKGAYEPDLARDITDRWMITEPDTAPTGRKVYFNGFLSQYHGYLGSHNPNVAAARSAHAPPGAWNFAAMLGVWKDCNNDHYVGLGDNGLWEYRVELLNRTDICPGSTTPIVPSTGLPPENWFPSHNDRQWVREFLPIQWRDTQRATGDANAWNINDNAARVWADRGQPESTGGSSGGCPSAPQPRGTYHSTGGFVRWADCFDGYAMTDRLNALGNDIGACVNATPFAGRECVSTGIGLDDFGEPVSFADKPRDQGNSASVLNQRNPWGDEEEGTYVEAWDCTAAPIHSQNVGNVNSERTWVNVSAPRESPPVGTEGSPSGTANATGSGFDECERRSDTGGGTGGKAARFPYESNPYLAEGDRVNTPTAKTTTTVLEPHEVTRPAAPTSTVLGKGSPPGPTVSVSTLGFDAATSDFGAHAVTADGFWVQTGCACPPAFEHVTFYAFVSPTAVTLYSLTLPPRGTGYYGAESCGASTTGVKNGWACASTAWWKGGEGEDIEPRSTVLGPAPGVPIGARIKSPFNLRDVDCVDESAIVLRGEGLTIGVVPDTTNAVLGRETQTRCASSP